MTCTTAAIRKGDPYSVLQADGRTRLPAIAECDGLLVEPIGYIVPDARMAGVLNQLGRFTVKHRKGHK
jgi:hypothetical protein